MATKKRIMPEMKINVAERVLTERQIKRVSQLAKIDPNEAAGKNMIELEQAFKWKIDPKLLLFRKVCGQVVKHDAATGEDRPVPYATVHVEDTDCKLLGIFPVESPWAWFLPVSCTREEIATVTTDECGHFCVWIPRFDIDTIIQWRKERFCFPELFVKPSIRDILDKLVKVPEIKKPFPEPDPAPWYLKKNPKMLTKLQEYIGRDTVERIASLSDTAAIGESVKPLSGIMDDLAFKNGMTPILPKELEGKVAEELKTMNKKHSALLSVNRQLEPKALIGPFIRCVDMMVPELKLIVDVPDITFRVTQDVDGDGNEEVIYSESFFDVRWNENPIPDVKLYASEIALTSVSCDVPDVTVSDEGIHFAGLMPVGTLAGAYHDNSTGYALRPNRPHPSGLFSDALPNPPAQTPFKGTLQLYGNNQRPGAAYYRIMYRQNGGSAAPMTNSWHLFRVQGGTLQKQIVAPDANGWYPIIPSSEGWHPHNLLMNWPTGANGKYEVYMEFGNGAKNVLNPTPPSVMFEVDNTRPALQFTKLEWREAGTFVWKEVDMVCTVIERNKGKDIELRVSFEGSGEHFRSIRLSAAGCGLGNPLLTSLPATNEHWYTGPSDTHFSNAGNPAVYGLPGTLPQGAYRFSLRVDSRAFNPAGGDGGYEADWEYDPLSLYLWAQLQIAVIDK